MKIGFLLYPVSKVKVDEDSSFWLMLELKRRGHEVSYFESRDLLWLNDSPHAFLVPARLDARKGYLPSLPVQKPVNLSGMDCIFIRKEPPFENEYLHALQVLELIKEKVFVLNDPAGIALANEKLFTLNFKNYLPETLVTENVAQAKNFIKHLGKKVVVKPLNEKGGHGIFSLEPRDQSLPSLLEIATDFGTRKVIIQRFVEHQKSGDKRLLVLNGRILGAFVRRPSRYDFRANLSIGASMHKGFVTTWDEKLLDEISPKLFKFGLYFVGIDVIGKMITEINVTSPAGIPEINHFQQSHPERDVADFIELRAANR